MVRMKWKKLLNTAKRTWNFVWHGESIASYVAFIIVAYLLLKFVAFPMFLYVFSLSDVVAVVSGSMSHKGANLNYTYYQWLKFNNLSDASFPFKDGLEIGDAVALIHTRDIKIGDVVVFYSGNRQIIHRVVAFNGTHLTTKGDANPYSLAIEINTPITEVQGKAILKIPFIGWPRSMVSWVFSM